MLIKKYLNVECFPSQVTSGFYKKAISIFDITELLIFINRGQGLVVKRLKSIIPGVSNMSIRQDLQVMLEAHQENIRYVENAFNQ